MDANLQTVLIVAIIVIGLLLAIYLLRDRIRSGSVRLEADKGMLSAEMTADPAISKPAAADGTAASPEKQGVQGVKIDNNQISKGGEQGIRASEGVDLSVSGNKVGGKQIIEIGPAAKKGKKS